VDVAVWRCMLMVELPLGLLDTSCGESWWVAVWAMMAAMKLCRVGGDVSDLFVCCCPEAGQELKLTARMS
jgi:hypothetical protein